MGRRRPPPGVFVSIGPAGLMMDVSSIIVYAQVVFVIFIVPLFSMVIFGML